jgi:hypothetical protein
MKANSAQRQAARDYYQCDEIIVHDDAIAEVVEDGYWVQAWVWLDNNDATAEPTETV